MRVTVIQKDIKWGEVQKNLASFSQLIDKAPKSDLYVLPEMFSTGFISGESGLCEKEPAEGLAWMRETAARTRAAVAGSIALQLSDGRRLNRFHFVCPDGTTYCYDKHHLFGDEINDFSSGNEKVVVEYQGFKFLLAVCYDLRFPVWLRNAENYDAMIIVASWPAVRRYAWDVLLQARAIENHAYVIACNRVGQDPVASYSGGSVIIDPMGSISATCQDSEEGFCSIELDASKLEQARRRRQDITEKYPEEMRTPMV